MDENVKRFKEGIFSLNTRRFGKVAELMIQKLYGLEDPNSNAYDLLTNNNQRVEVKFSKVLKKCPSKIDAKNAMKQILASTLERRFLSFEKAKTSNFNCNIQQVKPIEFDWLYYGCFFEDKILICKIHSKELIGNAEIFYSEHQHRGNVGEGQFHITDNNIETHLNKYFVTWLTYEDLYQMFS